MNIIVAVLKDISSYFNPRTKKGFVRLSILVVIIFIGNGILQKEDTPDEVSFPQLRHVEVASVLTLTGSLKLSLIGSVESLAQADIQTETSGRVTSVNVELGQDVIAGTVVAQLENASQFAALLQAEGVYEAAVAAAAQSDIGTTEASIALDVAKNSALTTYRNAFTTFRSILQSDVDQLFSEPKASLPGVRVRAGTDVTYLNTERVAFEALLNNWQIATDNATAYSDFYPLLDESRASLTRLNKMIDVLVFRLQDTETNARFTQSEVATLTSSLEADRTTVNSFLGTINSSLTSLESAQESLSRAELGGTKSEVSSANAQVKQALGSLRGAQANYNTTILRTPITGVVNSLDVKVGDFANSFTTIAKVANNSALEITTFVGDDDRSRITVGDIVVIENNIEGTITAIAPSVNADTKKIEVKIGTESNQITNGESVSITIASSESDEGPQIIAIPLTSVKLTSNSAYVFTVTDGKLVQHEVELGRPNGSVVTIASGIDPSWEIVVDARGLLEGREVNIISN